MSKPKWGDFIKKESLEEGSQYFLAKRGNIGDQYHEHFFLYARGLNGKTQWSVKPGIALRFGKDTMFENLSNNPDLWAIKVPDDADSRWSARKPPVRRYKR